MWLLDWSEIVKLKCWHEILFGEQIEMNQIQKWQFPMRNIIRILFYTHIGFDLFSDAIVAKQTLLYYHCIMYVCLIDEIIVIVAILLDLSLSEFPQM